MSQIRLHESASSVKLWRRCQLAGYYRYVLGIRTPEYPWEMYAAGKTPPEAKRGRAAALGKAVHAVGEAWFRDSIAPSGGSLPGRIYLSGVQHLPHPDECLRAEVESPGGCEQAGDHLVRRMHGVAWAMYRDLIVWPRAEAAHRLGLSTPTLVDYKTTSNFRYAGTPESLADDLAVCLYALSMIHGGEVYDVTVPCRWLYLLTRGATRMSRPVDFTAELSRSEDVVGQAAEEVLSTYSQIREESDACPNLEACSDYGGCEFGPQFGGPCKAASALTIGLRKVALSPEQKARAERFRSTVQGEQAAQAEAPAAPEAPASAPTTRPKPRARPAPEAEQATTADDPVDAAVAALRAALARRAERASAFEQARSALDAADAELEDRKDALISTLSRLPTR